MLLEAIIGCFLLLVGILVGLWLQPEAHNWDDGRCKYCGRERDSTT